MLYLLDTGRPTLTKLLGLSASQPDKPPEGQLIFWFCDSFYPPSSLPYHNEKHFCRISWVCQAYLSATTPPLPTPPFVFLPPPTQNGSVSHTHLFALFPYSQGKSSSLNWPQELLLSDFNAPYSVDSISITPVTKD